MSQIQELQDRASLLRARIIETSHKTGTPHLGSCLSCVDILTSLYFAVLRIDPADPRGITRDRFILSKGHGAPALFQVLAMRGYYPESMLEDYGKDGGVFAEHPPTPDHLPGIEAATGSLGHGLPIGLGMALAYLRRSDAKSKIVVLLSDGDNNVSTQMTPRQAAQAAADLGVQVFTVLVGSEGSLFGNAVDPATLQNIATITGGQFFRAADTRELSASFEELRQKLDKTRRKHSERKKDKELFVPLVGLAFGLLVLELLLSATRFRRFP